MCGILCYICQTENSVTEFLKTDKFGHCKSLIKARGPDSHNEKIESLSSQWHAYFLGSVLWTQGESPFEQPCTDSSNNILLWNGDVFSGSLVPEGQHSDTKAILDSLEPAPNIISVLEKIEGPYSFIYYQKSTNRLFFGKDKFGRHSLLLGFEQTPSQTKILLSSTAPRDILTKIDEVPAVGIFALDLSGPIPDILFYPWNKKLEDSKSHILHLQDTLELPRNIVFCDKNFQNPKRTLETLETTTDFESLSSIPQEIEDFYSKAVEGLSSSNFAEIMERLLENERVGENVAKLGELLERSIQVRVQRQPKFCRDCVGKFLSGEEVSCGHSKVGVLFSGGLDSAVIAAIADKYVNEGESIDLINVAFERTSQSDYEVPDRVTGKATYEELQLICPGRKWNFVEVNVPAEEVLRSLTHIAHLVNPLIKVLDESLACAVYFASRADGALYPGNEAYQSPCRILLLGMGADELFGGYVRHRNSLKRTDWGNFAMELKDELARMWKRNLGRDDRVVSDCGRQARYPYLDDRLVEFVQSLKPWDRCYPQFYDPGLGDKLLLRLLARKLNLKNAANFRKRAFQFGSRIANSKENAMDDSRRLIDSLQPDYEARLKLELFLLKIDKDKSTDWIPKKNMEFISELHDITM